jgi:hypothetical protein
VSHPLNLHTAAWRCASLDKGQVSKVLALNSDVFLILTELQIDMEIHVECTPDETLVKKIGFTKKQVTHHAGKARVFATIQESKNQLAHDQAKLI